MQTGTAGGLFQSFACEGNYRYSRREDRVWKTGGGKIFVFVLNRRNGYNFVGREPLGVFFIPEKQCSGLRQPSYFAHDFVLGIWKEVDRSVYL